MLLNDTNLVILNYERPENVFHIASALSNILPIIVVNNNPKVKINNLVNALVLNNDENKYCMDRWYKALQFGRKYTIILDDDILPSLQCIKDLRKEAENSYLVGIYGKNNVASANKYEDLDDVWCTESSVDLVVGACSIVDTEALRSIADQYLLPWGLPKRGDDLIVSLALSHKYKVLHKTITTKVLSLPTHGVGLNTSKDHYKLRWDVINQFMHKYN